MKKITFKINQSGTTEIVDVCGWGGNCQEVTKGVESRLGAVNEGSRSLTENFYKPEIESLSTQELQ